MGEIALHWVSERELYRLSNIRRSQIDEIFLSQAGHGFIPASQSREFYRGVVSGLAYALGCWQAGFMDIALSALECLDTHQEQPGIHPDVWTGTRLGLELGLSHFDPPRRDCEETVETWICYSARLFINAWQTGH